MADKTKTPFAFYTGSYTMDEDRAIYGLGPNREMPSLCPHCKGNPRDRAHCAPCGSTGMLGVPGISASSGQRELNQASRGGPSSGRGSSKGNSSVYRDSRR